MLEESIRPTNVEPLKYKDNALVIFKNYKALREKQSNCQLKILYTDEEEEYMGDFDSYLNKNVIFLKVTAFNLFE